MTLEDRLRAGFTRVGAELKAVKAAQDGWPGAALTLTDVAGTTGFPGARTFYMRIRRCPAGLTISRISLIVATSAGNVSVAVHRNTGAGLAATPGQQVATSGAVACPAASPAAEIPLGSTVAVSAGDWLALSCDNIFAAFGGTVLQSGGSPGAASVHDPLVRVGTGHPAPTVPVLGTVAPAARAFQLIGLP